MMSDFNKKLLDKIASEMLSNPSHDFPQQPRIITAFKIVRVYEIKTQTTLTDDEFEAVCDYVVKKFIAN